MGSTLFAESDYDMNKICRSCLKQTNDLVSVFDVKQCYNSLSLHEIIMVCAQVEVSQDDGMPSKICLDCMNQVINAYNFKLKCEQSDISLREIILKKEIEKNAKNPYIIKKELDYNNSSNNEIIIKSEFTTVKDDPFFNEPEGCTDENDDFERDADDVSSHIGDINEENINISDIDGLIEIKGDTIENITNTKESQNEQDTIEITNRDIQEKVTYDKLISCKQCDMKFDTKKDLRTHSSVHKNIRRKRGTINSIEIEENEFMNSFKNLNIICKICESSFNKISQLKLHIQNHLDSNTFIGIDLHSKQFLFDLTKIAPNIESNENLINHIISDIEQNNLLKFYQITTLNGYELNLSDSESDDDNVNGNEMNKNIHACEKCGYLYNRSYKLNHHVKLEHEHFEFLHVCNECGRKFPTEFLLNRHIKRQCENKLKQYYCGMCKLKFLWQYSYDLHNEKFHSGKKIKRRSAQNENTVNKKSRNTKDKPKEKNFVCSTCNKAFYFIYDLERHRKTHIPSYVFECNICQKKFNRKDNLKSHMRIHKEVKEESDKHLCVYCGRSFSNSSNLIVHMRRHTGEKPYKCDLCDKGFPRSSDLQCHRRTHTGEKPCLCTICGKGFSRSNKLVRHMRIHTGVRPYKCTHCDRAFTQSNDLTLHIRRHTGEKPYVCGICGDRFIQGTALQTHRKLQGHFEENNQPAPFASISVNNPNRFTNANRVNRIRIYPDNLTITSTEAPVIKPVISRKKTASVNAETTVVPSSTSPFVQPISASIAQPVEMILPQTNELESSNTNQSDAVAIQNTNESESVIPNVSIAPTFISNGVNFLANQVLMQNIEVSTAILSIASYNSNFNQQ